MNHLIMGKRDAVRDLFTTIEGRIDAGVVLAGGEGTVGPGNFLGFHVAGLDVIHYLSTAQERGEVSLPTPQGALV